MCQSLIYWEDFKNLGFLKHSYRKVNKQYKEQCRKKLSYKSNVQFIQWSELKQCGKDNSEVNSVVLSVVY